VRTFELEQNYFDDDDDDDDDNNNNNKRTSALETATTAAALTRAGDTLRPGGRPMPLLAAPVVAPTAFVVIAVSVDVVFLTTASCQNDHKHQTLRTQSFVPHNDCRTVAFFGGATTSTVGDVAVTADVVVVPVRLVVTD
jgi:hypothetical protein